MKRIFSIFLTLVVIVAVILATLYLATQCLLPGVCTNKPSFTATTLLTKIQSLSSLTTTRYTYSTIVTTESDMPDWLKALYGQKQIMVAVGYITAGIDMKQAQAAQNGDALNLTLPAPTLQDCILDEGKTYIAALDKGLFAPSSPTLDQESRRFAVQQLRQSAVNGDILTQAQTQAQTAITDFINLVGVPNVQVTFSPADPNVPLPASCA
ncbi:MAG: DUF4230 domain-containing protein [Anaerolineae bacterium]|nr:DUF4230 domain-containing protein [Anaerolineae bacterium]